MKQETVQKQNTGQLQIQYMRILAMDAAALDALAQSAFLENPFIELREGAANTAPIFPELRAPETGGRYSPFLEQLCLTGYSEIEIALMKRMIDSLDENGYYSMSAKETASVFGVRAATAEKCLAALRSLEPAGVFASDLAHCLITQLAAKGRLSGDMEMVINGHLADLARAELQKISRQTGISLSRLRELRREIRLLDPRPFYKADCRKSAAIAPDVICEWDGLRWEVALARRCAYELSAQCYADEGLDRQTAAYIEKKRREAELLFGEISLRESTLLRIAEALTKKQHAALLRGSAPAPFTMAQLAAQMGYSPSTVSRACSGKYIACPAGVLPMNGLFCAPRTACESSDAQIKKRVKMIVERESPSAPFSDDAICERLARFGIEISRRTVAKYRAALGIPSSYERKAR